MSRLKASRFAGPALILLAAAVATAPILLHGSYCGDDFEFHVLSWFNVQQSWLHGIPYPHWMPSANYGAGEPRFMFYPPLTWMLGAALGFVLPWQWVPIAVVFLFLVGTGLAVRMLALEALTDAPATLAGCTALFSGYALFTAYERTAYAELTGGFWIPLLLLFALRDRDPSASLLRRAMDGSTLPLALMVAGAWLSNGPLGVMASYLLATVAITASVLNRSWAHFIRAAIAGLLGVGLAGLYLIPAAWEQRWADLRAAIVYPVFEIENNWFFDRPANPMLAPFWTVLYRASMLAVVMIGVAMLSLLVVFLRRKLTVEKRPSVAKARIEIAGSMRGFPPPPSVSQFSSIWKDNEGIESMRAWWIPLALIPAAVLFLLLPISDAVWNLLPRLRFLQYPWRWLLVTEAPMGIFFAAAVWPSRDAKRLPRVAIGLACTLAFLGSTFLAARTFLRVCQEGDTAAELLTWYRNGGGHEGTDEYEPAGTDHWKIPTGLPDACFTRTDDIVLGESGGESSENGSIPAWHREQGSCEAVATAQVREPEHMRVAMTVAHPGFLILRLVSYPAWRITVNGKLKAPTDPADLRDDGLIAVPVPQGPVEVIAEWVTLPDAVAGRCVSALALLLLIALGLLERRLSPVPIRTRRR